MVRVTACGSSDSGNQGGKDGALSISWWIPAGEDSSYYPTYDDNPCIKYIEQNLTFNGQKIDLTFLVPTSGAELDNFNTLLATDEYADILDLSRSKMSATELYEDDVLWDLTPYVEQYMPNYMKGLDANPDLKSYVLSDGKYLQIYGIREIAQTAHGEWDYYTNTGFPDSQIRFQFTTDQSNNYNMIYANVDTFMSSQLPLFITGKLDINSDKDWNDYCKMLSKYSPDKVTEMYEGLFQK